MIPPSLIERAFTDLILLFDQKYSATISRRKN
jgi:hypothetical protein